VWASFTLPLARCAFPKATENIQLKSLFVDQKREKQF
jgi:hypothetical protein